MQITRLEGLLAALALALLAGCAAPCGAPGRLCAPTEPNTSTLAKLPVQPPASAFARPGAAQEEPPAPPTPVAGPLRIALLVPLQSPTLALPATAVRDGFLAAWQHDRAGVEVDVVGTGDDVAQVLDAYRLAAASHDLVAGPLARPAVNALAASGTLARPTIALNHPDPGVALPPNMLVIGLSTEDEARQVADWAAREHPAGRALVLAGDQAWQQRMAQGFERRWSELGRNSHLAELPATDGRVDRDAIDLVRTQMEIDPPELIFAALDAGQLRQVRAVLGTAVACYAASPANPGRDTGQPMAELNGVRLLDLPWEVEPAHQAVMVYPRWLESGHTLDMDRLYALGIDAYRVAQAIARAPNAPVELDGVTGKLAASLSGNPAFRRVEAAVVVRDGKFEAAGP